MLALPKPLMWGDRAASMPYIKGGGDAQIDSLRALLNRVDQDGADPATVDAVNRSRPRGFIERAGRGSWKVSEAGRIWLESGDNDFLIGVFHSQIRFIGELLEQLSVGHLTHSQIVNIAENEYDLPWGSPDQVRRRTTWLRAAGLIELRFDNYLSINPQGQQFLARIENRTPNSARAGGAAARETQEIPKATPKIADFISTLSAEKLVNRRRLIGYFPTGESSIEALKVMTNAASPRISKEDWATRCKEKFNIRESSAVQAIGSFRGCGLIEQVARDVDALTPLAASWLESDSDLDLIRLMHGHIRFFGEILALLDETGSSVEVTARALEFDIPQPDLSRRIAILMEAGTIEESGIRRFRLTPVGQALLEELPIEPFASASTPDIIPENANTGNERNERASASSQLQIKDELRQAARAAHDYTRFERAVASAFGFLGFSVEQLGGPGRTDVYMSAPLPGNNRFILIADAKASAKGQVINFDVVTLREHKEQHGADYVIAVGESFADRRTVERAKSENVGLLSVEMLCRVLDLASEGVIGIVDIRKLVSVGGIIEGGLIEKSSQDNRRMLRLVKHTLSALAVEAVGDDEVTKGALAPSDIYMQLRGQSDPPTLAEISLVLEFLSNPLIRCVAKLQEKYFLAEHVDIVSNRLKSLSHLVAGAAVES